MDVCCSCCIGLIESFIGVCLTEYVDDCNLCIGIFFNNSVYPLIKNNSKLTLLNYYPEGLNFFGRELADMRNESSQKIIVIGSGSLAVSVAAILKSFGKNVLLVEVSDITTFSISSRAAKLSIPLIMLEKSQVLGFLKKEICYATENKRSRKPLTIFSVENMYIFPAEITKISGIKIINYHNSLLPRHRGMNAEAWTIYEGDSQAGFTWHLVDEGLDTGTILYQCSFETNDRSTSLSLLQDCSKLARETFPNLISLFDELIEEHSVKLPVSTKASFHNAKDLPNNGVLDPSWSIDRISRFLRAFDYGKLQLLGRPTVEIEGIHYLWGRYCIKTESERLASSTSKEGKCLLDFNLHEKRISFSYPEEGTIVLEDVCVALAQDSDSSNGIKTESLF